jgi:hypothetical protein
MMMGRRFDDGCVDGRTHVETMRDATNSSDKYPSDRYPLKDLTRQIIGALPPKDRSPPGTLDL